MPGEPGEVTHVVMYEVQHGDHLRPIDTSCRAACSATRWLGTSASRWVGMTGDGKGPADGVGGAWWCPGCRGGGRVVLGYPFARVMAVVTRAMLVRSRLPRTRARWTGMWLSPRLAAMRRTAASGGEQLSWRVSRAVLASSQTM